jgi:hypothetical protein
LEQDLEPEELGTGAKGKRGELTVIGELLRYGLHVFLPIVDRGVDCVVDIGGGNYREVQIKYRENKATFTARFTRPRDNFLIVCWLNDHGRDDFWTIPSKVFHKLGRHGVPTVVIISSLSLVDRVQTIIPNLQSIIMILQHFSQERHQRYTNQSRRHQD